jgi:hypothetical protein
MLPSKHGTTFYDVVSLFVACVAGDRHWRALSSAAQHASFEEFSGILKDPKRYIEIEQVIVINSDPRIGVQINHNGEVKRYLVTVPRNSKENVVITLTEKDITITVACTGFGNPILMLFEPPDYLRDWATNRRG